ncbi:MAG: hypothetical protein AVDCRST_MAG89-1621, partial [uncultured Gemmatimonadetes bacterium]
CNTKNSRGAAPFCVALPWGPCWAWARRCCCRRAAFRAAPPSPARAGCARRARDARGRG